LVGGWNTLFSYLVFAALYFLLRGYLHYMVLYVISSVLSITNAYIGFKLFVFKTRGHYLREYSRFYVVYGGALALNLLLLPLVVETCRISPVVAQAGLALITVAFSYFGHKNFSFKAA
jgi:putative flippase GtrA